MKVDVRGYFFVLVEVVADFHPFNSTGIPKVLQLSVAWRDSQQFSFWGKPHPTRQSEHLA